MIVEMNRFACPKPPSPNAEDLSHVEEEADFSLPDDYKDFLTSQNGGRPVFSSLAIKRFAFDVTIEWFLGVNPEGLTRSSPFTASVGDCLRRRPYLKEFIFPIAEQCSEPEFVVGYRLKGRRRGKIDLVMCPTEGIDESKFTLQQNAYSAANTFTSLIDRLFGLSLTIGDSVELRTKNQPLGPLLYLLICKELQSDATLVPQKKASELITFDCEEKSIDTALEKLLSFANLKMSQSNDFLTINSPHSKSNTSLLLSSLY